MSRRRPMSDLLAYRNCLGRVPPGYGERHVRTVGFGTGEARLPSLVSKYCSYKPMVKSSGGKRESDGVVVPLIAARNAAGGKGPDFGHAGHGVHSCKDMAGIARSNHPRRREPALNVRQLQDWLWAAAKQLPLPRIAVLDPGAVTSRVVAAATVDEKAA